MPRTVTGKPGSALCFRLASRVRFSRNARRRRRNESGGFETRRRARGSVIVHLAFHFHDVVIDSAIHHSQKPIQHTAQRGLHLVFERQLHLCETIAHRQKFHETAQFHFPARRMEQHLTLIIRVQKLKFKRALETDHGYRIPKTSPTAGTAQVPKPSRKAPRIRKTRLGFIDGLANVENFLNEHRSGLESE
jgi:hypothetical protein